MPPQIAFTSLVYPALILAYMGQAAYLSKHHNIYTTSYQIGFYVSVPGNVIPFPKFFQIYSFNLADKFHGSIRMKYGTKKAYSWPTGSLAIHILWVGVCMDH